jgi:rhamnosyltransferase
MDITKQSVALIVPTYNASTYMPDFLSGLAKQSCVIDSVLVIDSSSADDTVAQAKKAGIKTHVIPQSEFDHGGTRQLATELIKADIYIFMTQDAICADSNTFQNLLKAFDDPKVGCAYGRQLPHKDAGLLAAHAREFNYPDQSYVRSYDDAKTFGIKTCFNSNSFAAYRATALREAGGFLKGLILGEDMVVAARMQLKGWRVAYCAEAKAYHSHNYTVAQEFKRYFDIGVMHHDQVWILDKFASPNKEGFKFVLSQWAYCIKRFALWPLWRSGWMIAAKLLGYRLGRRYTALPTAWRKKLSMCRFYWT